MNPLDLEEAHAEQNCGDRAEHPHSSGQAVRVFNLRIPAPLRDLVAVHTYHDPDTAQPDVIVFRAKRQGESKRILQAMPNPAGEGFLSRVRRPRGRSTTAPACAPPSPSFWLRARRASRPYTRSASSRRRA